MWKLTCQPFKSGMCSNHPPWVRTAGSILPPMEERIHAHCLKTDAPPFRVDFFIPPSNQDLMEKSCYRIISNATPYLLALCKISGVFPIQGESWCHKKEMPDPCAWNPKVWPWLIRISTGGKPCPYTDKMTEISESQANFSRCWRRCCPKTLPENQTVCIIMIKESSYSWQQVGVFMI